MTFLSLRISVHSELVIKNLLFLILLACQFALFPALDAAPGHNLAWGQAQCMVNEGIQFGSELPKCMIPKRAPKPPSSEVDPVPWDRNYMNLYTPMPNGGLVVRDDGMQAELRITSVNQSCECTHVELSTSCLYWTSRLNLHFTVII